MRIAVFGPHPDDQELGMGGTIARLVAGGHEVTLVDMTNGEPTPHGTSEIRAREAAAAAAILGATRMQLGLINRELVPDLASRAVVASAIRALQPDIIFAPHPEDAHPDHIAACALIEAARFAAKYTKCELPGDPWHAPHLFHYYAIHLRSVPQPSVIADTSGHAQTKRSAILAYESQFVRNTKNTKVPDWIDAAGVYFGSRIGTDSAEPFFSRECVAIDFAQLAR
ncbi:MAG: bacillithiol biosynthesis deacetylase BshB1 [Phycisphaerales bacterium]|nr:bacillithiol biosynthesis deacetylase BshB1 [Phycisphaerales bacterium]